MTSPIVFRPDMEKPEAGEAETAAKLADTLRQIQETTAKDYGHAVRSVHAKSHALLEGTLTVVPGLAGPLAQGLFAQPGTYPAILRLSTAPGDVLPDAISSPRGIAVKVLGVPGARVAGSEDDTTQDFVTVDGPAFGAPDAKHFAPQLALLGKTTDKAVGLKKVLSAVLQALEGGLEALGTESATLQALGGRRNTNPLGDIHYSQTPYLYGENIAKFALVPVSPNLTAETNAKIHPAGRPDALREEITKVTEAGAMSWELRVQLCTDLEAMPIEDAAKVWDEKLSPFQTVARIDAAPQPAWTTERAKTVDDALAFNPWHCLAAHRPLGSINRVRGVVYPKSAAFRGQHNGCPMREPTSVKL